MSREKFLITREFLIKLLLQWKSGEIDAESLFNLMDEMYPGNILVQDKEGDKEVSVALEVCSYLAMMDVDLTTVDDIDHFIEFLKTPLGKFDEGYKKLDSYLNSIDRKARKKQLKNIMPYSVIFGDKE